MSYESTEMHKPGKQSCAYLEGGKKPQLILHKIFFLILKQEPIDLPYHVSFTLCFTKALSNMLLKGSVYDKDCLKEVKR